MAGSFGPRPMDGNHVNQTLENAMEDAETDLSGYLAGIGQAWPKGLRVEWAQGVSNQDRGT